MVKNSGIYTYGYETYLTKCKSLFFVLFVFKISDNVLPLNVDFVFCFT